MMNNWFGYVLVVAASAMFGMSSIIIKYIFSTGLSPTEVVVIQGIMELVMAWTWVLASGKNIRIPAPQRWSMVSQGAIGFFLTSILFYNAIGVLGAALATLLLFTYPAIVVTYEVAFQHRKVSGYEKAALFMAIVGLLFCLDLFSVLPGAVVGWAGVMLGLSAAVTNAFLNINGEKLMTAFETPVITAWMLTFSTPMLFIVYQPVWLLSISLTWLQVGLLIVGSAMIFIPLMVYLAGIGRIGAGAASIASTVEIPITLLLAWVFLNEALSGSQVLGGAFIMISIIILYYHRKQNEEQENSQGDSTVSTGGV